MKLSIIVPVYNTAAYLKQCIESILSQSVAEIELILVDDGSTDESGSICDDYAQKDTRVLVYHGKHRGPCFSRKLGLERASGEYVTFVDSDDFVAKSSYELAWKDMERGIDIISFGIMRFFPEGRVRLDRNPYATGIYTKKDIERNIFPTMIWDESQDSFGLNPAFWNKVFKKNLLIDLFQMYADMVNFHYGEDVAMIYPLMMHIRTLSIHHEAYYYYRQRCQGRLAPYISDPGYFDKLYELYRHLMQALSAQETFVRQIHLFYMKSVMLKGKQYGKGQYRPEQVFPFQKVSQGDRIVLYGAGNIGRLYRAQVAATGYCKIVSWVDKNYGIYEENVISPEKIGQTEYDKVVIAIEDNEIQKAVKEVLHQMGVPKEKVIC